MAELKTKPTRRSPNRFISQVDHPVRRADCETLLPLFEKITGEKPVMWGDSIVGFGQYHYQQRSGQPAMWPLTGFSPRKQNLAIYVMPGFKSYAGALSRLGKHRHSVSCLYINKLADVDLDVLSEMIRDSVAIMRARYREKK